MKRTYTEAVEWLFANLPMFQRVGQSAYKKDLGNIRTLCLTLNNPQENYKIIHVAGTNGKGSTCHMLASVLQESGYKVGLTTSPHLKDFRERIRVNGEICTEQFVVDFIEQNEELITSINASFFEIAIAMAFTYFAQENVDIAVIETGLGGRLDSTNIVQPILSVITNIGLDHTQFLGSTLAKIAAEKAGIIKPNTPVVIGEYEPETKPIFVEFAQRNNAEIIFAQEQKAHDFQSDLKGIYQQKNIQTVVTVFNQLKKLGISVSDSALERGLLHVRENTHLRGRWDVLQLKNPMIVADTAHNPHGLKEVTKQLQQTNYSSLHLVMGFVSDKDVKEILHFFPANVQYYFSQPDVPRKLHIEELKKIVPKNLSANYYQTIAEALQAAKEKANAKDLIYIGGSTFVVAEVIDY